MGKAALHELPAQAESAYEPGYHTRALVRALSILEMFSLERPILAVKDLHLLLALPKPTISRLASVLEQFGYLNRRGQTYVLGPKLLELGSLFASQDSLAETSRRPLEEASADSQQTTCLGVLRGPNVVHVVVVPSLRPVHYVTKVGNLAPTHTTGLGKALLADLEDDALEVQLSQLSTKRYTPKSIVDHQRLRKEIAAIRRRGYAIDDEETAKGLKCVAIAVRLARVGSVAISFSGPAADFTEHRIQAYAKRLAATASQLQEAFVTAADSRPDAVTQLNSRPSGSERPHRRSVAGTRRT